MGRLGEGRADVAERPLVRFTSNRVRDTGDGTLRVEGTLEAAGTVIWLAFDARVRQSGDELEVEATTADNHHGSG